MALEYLPDELLLIVFLYLHKFDIIYTFGNLNQRFQRIATRYLYDIDANREPNVSYKQFSFVLNHIILNERLITVVRSLKLSQKVHLKLFKLHINKFINLESLTLTHNLKYDDYRALAIDTLPLPLLSELSLPHCDLNMLQTIAPFSTSYKLNTLGIVNLLNTDLISSWPEMLYVKRTFVSINSSVKVLMNLFKAMPRLEELNLSICRHLSHTDTLVTAELPSPLKKLHLEIADGSWVTIQNVTQFLNLFKDHLQSLTLIIFGAVEEFSNFDQFQSLVGKSSHLQTFQYDIRTLYQPDVRFSSKVTQTSHSSYSLFTLPRPQPFDISLVRRLNSLDLHLGHSLSSERLLHCTMLHVNAKKLGESLPTKLELNDDLKFMKLKELTFNSMSRFDVVDKPIQSKANEIGEECQILSKLLELSPNLDTLTIFSNNTEEVIQHLKLFSPSILASRITHFTVQDYRSCVTDANLPEGSSDYHWTFFNELSNILPNLKVFKFLFYAEKFIEQYPQTLVKLLEEMRNYYSKLVYLQIRIRLLIGANEEEESVVESYRKCLTKSYENENSLCYEIDCETSNTNVGFEDTYDFSIWL